MNLPTKCRILRQSSKKRIGSNEEECVTYSGRFWFYNIPLPHHVEKWQSHDTIHSPTGNEQKNSSVAAALSDPAYQMVWIPTFCHTLNEEDLNNPINAHPNKRTMKALTYIPNYIINYPNEEILHQKINTFVLQK